RLPQLLRHLALQPLAAVRAGGDPAGRGDRLGTGHHRAMRPPSGVVRLALLCAVLALAACSGKKTRPDHPNKPIQRTPPSSELYAPDRMDGGPPQPPDLSRMAEPIPVPEPRSRYGNRSPYKVLGRTYRVLESASGYV